MLDEISSHYFCFAVMSFYRSYTYDQKSLYCSNVDLILSIML